MLLFVSWGNKFVGIECPPFDAPKSTHGLFTSFSLSRCCCLHFCRNRFGLMLAQGYFKGQRSSIIHTLQLFMTLCDMQSSSGNYSMSHQVPMVSLLLLVYLSSVSFISVEISLGSCCWHGYILRAKLRINYKLQVFMNMQSLSGNYSMRHQVPTVFQCCCLHFWRNYVCAHVGTGIFGGSQLLKIRVQKIVKIDK